MIQTIWQSLETILNSLVATTSLEAVYNYPPKKSDTYPYAVIFPGQLTEEIFDTIWDWGNNQVTINYTISVFDRNKDTATMENRMRALADDLLDELRKQTNLTLSWLVDRLPPFTVSHDYDNTWTEPVRLFVINMQIILLKPSN